MTSRRITLNLRPSVAILNRLMIREQLLKLVGLIQLESPFLEADEEALEDRLAYIGRPEA